MADPTLGLSDGWLTFARCDGCGRASERRPTGTAPEGWSKIVSPPYGRVTYRCPDCLEAADAE